jgi:hypothetical protein
MALFSLSRSAKGEAGKKKAEKKRAEGVFQGFKE